MLTATAQLLLLILSTAGFLFNQSVSLAYEPNSFVPNEMIVKYKSGQSPDDLVRMVAKRREDGHPFIIGAVVLFLKDLTGKIHGLETPEDRLIRINQTDDSIGVVAKEKLLDSDEDREPIYVFRLDGSRSVDTAVELYRNLPEVEYAESNFIYSSAGI